MFLSTLAGVYIIVCLWTDVYDCDSVATVKGIVTKHTGLQWSPAPEWSFTPLAHIYQITVTQFPSTLAQLALFSSHLPVCLSVNITVSKCSYNQNEGRVQRGLWFRNNVVMITGQSSTLVCFCLLSRL